MKRVLLMCLLLQAVCADKSISVSISKTPAESPADVSYVEGKAPEELKAGPAKNNTKSKEKVAHASFIHTSSREIPKDDEIENEEFERFIQKYHSRPTIETVFVSTSPSPPAKESEAEELNEDSATSEPQAEVFKRPAQLRTFERSVAHPEISSHILNPVDHHQTYTILNQPHDASHAGSGFILQSNGGDGHQYAIFDGGHYLPSYHGHGDQHQYQYANHLVPTTFNIAQNAVKTKTYEIRRPAIQKHYYDIEERVIIRPAGSVVVELDHPVAKVHKGESVVAVGGLHGVGGGFQSTQGGLSFSNTFGGSQGGLVGVGIQQSQGGIGISQGGFQGGLSGIGFQQSQGGIGISQDGYDFSQGGSQGGYDFSQGGFSGSGLTFASSLPAPTYSSSVGGFQQSQGAIGGSQGGVGFQQSQGAIGGSQGGVGFQQSQGAIGGSQGGAGIQQSQGGIVVSTTASPGSSSSTISIGTQQQQGGTQGGNSVAGFQQSQGGAVFSTTEAPRTVIIGDSSRRVAGAGFQQSQGAIGGSQGGAGFQQSQGGVFGSTTAGPGSIGINAGGFQQSQGGAVFSTTATPLFTPASPAPTFSGVGYQQSQGGIGISQGGTSGIGFQQSQGGGGVYSTIAPPYLPPAVTPTPTTIYGGSNGGFIQSQSGIGLSQSGAQGGLSGIGFQQSQGGIGLSQGGSQGGFSGFQQSQGGIGISQGGVGISQGGSGYQNSQGGIIYSTTANPIISISSSRPLLIGGGYSGASSTTAGPIFISTQQGDASSNVFVQANSNSQGRESVLSTTTTERSFSVSQDASAFARGSSSVNKNVVPIGDPNFQFPPYAEIHSRGQPPYAHYKEEPFAKTESQDYPRMRYQGHLLTGEVQADGGYAQYKQLSSDQESHAALSQHHQNPHETPAYVAELPTSSPLENQASQNLHHSGFVYQQPADTQTQYQHKFVGSSKQPVQASQISSSSHRQPPQVYRHFIRASSQPIHISEVHAPQHDNQQHLGHQHSAQIHAAPRDQVQHHSQLHESHQQYSSPQHSAQHQTSQQYSVKEHAADSTQASTQVEDYHSTAQQPEHSNQGSHHSVYNTPVYRHPVIHINQQPLHHNLVAETRHQQAHPQERVAPKQTTQDSKPQEVTEAVEEPIEVAEIQSSTHQQPMQYQQQVAATTKTLEPYNSGQRLYKQHGAPAKYTQESNLSTAPAAVHTVYFNNNQEHTSVRSQNIEVPPEPSPSTESTSVKSSIIESSTAAAAISSTTSAQKEEPSTQTQRQTYASVVAQGRPGILYAHPQHFEASHHSPGHRKQHFVHFNSQGSPLFSPIGQQFNFVYSQPPRGAYTHQHTQSHFAPQSHVEPKEQHVSVSNKGFQVQAQLPTSHQSQIHLTANNKPAQVTQSKITRSQSHDESKHTSARYEAIPSTTPDTVSTKKEHQKLRGPQKYRNEQTHSAITLRSGRTYGEHRVIASTPAPSDGGAASESVQTRRIVVNHPFQTVQEVVEQEPITKYHQVTVNAPASAPAPVQAAISHVDANLQQGQQKAAYHASAPYKVAATLNHPSATLSFHHGGSH